MNTVETLYSTICYSKYFIELNIDKSTQYVALWTHKRHPIPRPFGPAMECLLWVFQQKLIVYKGFPLYVARSKSRFTCHSHPLLRHMVPLNDGNCRLTMPIAALVTCYLKPLILACLNPLKGILPQYNIFTMDLLTQLKVVMLLLTSMIPGISHKQWQWLALRIWRHMLTFVTHNMTWCWAYVA